VVILRLKYASARQLAPWLFSIAALTVWGAVSNERQAAAEAQPGARSGYSSGRRPSSSASGSTSRTARRQTPASGWRPAGSTAARQAAKPLSAAPRPASKPQSNQSSRTEAAHQRATAPVAAPAPQLVAPDGTEDLDELAPIDELPDTPAPAEDAPGDPIEPEYTGDPNIVDEGPDLALRGPRGRSLRDAVSLPAGEPDRIARRTEDETPPTDPEEYQDREPAPPAEQLRPLSRNQRMLRDKIRNVLKYYYSRPVNSGDRGPWEVMHAMLGFEVHSRVLQGGPNGKPITAVGWLCFNQPCRDRTLMYLNEDGDIRVKVGPALQGHHGQLLALLAQARVRSDYPMRIDGQEFAVADLIEMEKETCYPKTELTFKLIGLQRYLDIEDTWVNDQGMNWDFPTLLREEMRQPVLTAACGGTHRLSGLALTVKKRQASGLPVDGAYAEAARMVANYQNYAYRLQNKDGSFSTSWFKGPGDESDVDRRLKTTGHILEWMIYASTEEELTNYRIVRAVNYLTNIMYANRNRDWEVGPLGHAVHALVLYDRLVFSKYDANPEAGPVAQGQSRTKR
jgi:hypothetical protein